MYKNVDFVFEGNCLFDPKVELTWMSMLSRGPAFYSTGIGESYLRDRAKRVGSQQRILVEHFPFRTIVPNNLIVDWQSMFNDYTNPAVLQNRFVNDINNAKVTAMFSGHIHGGTLFADDIPNTSVKNYYGNYFESNQGYFTIARVSSTKGIIAIKQFSTTDF